MIYFVYSLILFTVCVFSVTSSQDYLVQTLVNYIPKEIAFFFIGSLTIAYSFINKKVNGARLNSKYLFAFLAFIIFQFVWYFYRPIAMIDVNGGYSFNMTILRPFINIFIGVILIKILAESLVNKEWIKIFTLLVWVGFLLSVYSILQWFGIDWSNGLMEVNYINGVPAKKELMYTFLSHRTLTSSYIALTVPLCLMFKEVKYKIFLVFMIISLSLSDSLVAIVAVILSVLLFFLLSKKFKVVLLIILLSATGLILLNRTHQGFLKDSGRIAMWKQATKDVLHKKPFIGYGPGSFSRKYDVIGNRDGGDMVILFAHNDYIQGLSIGGLPLLAILIAYTISLLYRGISNIAKDYFIMDIALMCCLTSLIIISNGTFLFHYPPLAVLGILYISYIEYRHSIRS